MGGGGGLAAAAAAPPCPLRPPHSHPHAHPTPPQRCLQGEGRCHHPHAHPTRSALPPALDPPLPPTPPHPTLPAGRRTLPPPRLPWGSRCVACRCIVRGSAATGAHPSAGARPCRQSWWTRRWPALRTTVGVGGWEGGWVGGRGGGGGGLPAGLVDKALASPHPATRPPHTQAPCFPPPPSPRRAEQGLRPVDVYGGAQGAIAQLRGLAAWFEVQRDFQFYSSSGGLGVGVGVVGGGGWGAGDWSVGGGRVR